MSMPLDIPPPLNHQDVESWARRTLRIKYDCPDLDFFGRGGQGQLGIDLHGFRKDGSEMAVQVKKRQPGKLKPAVLEADLAAALKHFKNLKRFVFFVTTPRDAVIQLAVMEMNRAASKSHRCRVEILFWDSIRDIIGKDPALLVEYLSLPASMPEASGANAILSPFLQATRLQDSPDFEVAIRAIREGRAEAAIELLNSLRRNNWKSSSALFKYRLEGNTAQAYLALGQWEKAGSHFLAATKHKKNTSNSYVMKSRGLSLHNDNKGAMRAAQRAIALDKTNAKAWAAWLAQVTDTYDAVLPQVPRKLHKDAEVAVALSYLALSKEQLDQAIGHLRTALRAEPKWNVALVNLGALLLAKAKQGAWLLDGPLVANNHSSLLREADLMLSRSLNSVEAGEAEFRATALYNRASVRRLLGKPHEADKDLEGAYLLAPSDAKIAFATALRVSERGDDMRATEILKAHCNASEEGTKAKALLADIRLRSQDLAENKLALRQLKSLTKALPVSDDDLRTHILVQLVQLTLKLSPSTFSHLKLPSSRFRKEPPAIRDLLDLIVLTSVGPEKQAHEYLERLALRPAEQLGAVGVEAFSKLALKAGRPDVAANAMGNAYRHPALHVDVPRYALALFQAQRYREVLDLCREARLRGSKLRLFLTLEINVLVLHESRQEAISLLEDWLRKHPGDQEASLTRAAISHDAGDDRPARSLLKVLPEPETIEDVSIPTYTVVVLEVARWPSHKKARWIYRLWRRHRDQLAAWKSLLHTIYGRENALIKWALPTTSREHIAVLVEIDGLTEKRWFTLVPQGPTSSSHSEVDSGSENGKALLGKKIGDSVEIRDGVGSRTGRIVQMAPAERHAAQWCLDHAEEVFPGKFPIRRIQMPALQKAESSAEVEQALRPMTHLLEKHAAMVGTVQRAFTDHHASAFQLSKAINKQELECMDAIVHHPTLRLRTLHVPHGDTEALRGSIGSSKRFVLSISSLVILARLGILEAVLKTLRVVAPSLLLKELDLLITSIADSRWGRWIGSQGGRPVLTESTTVERLALLKFWRAVRDQSRAIACASGMAMLELDRVEILKCLNVIGPISTRCIAIARQAGDIVLCDDWAVAGFAFEIFKVNTLSTNGLLNILQRRNVFSEAETHVLRARMISMNLVGVDVSADVVVAAMRESNWDPSKFLAKRSVQAVADLFASPDERSLLAAVVISRVWREQHLFAQRNQLVQDISTSLTKRAGFNLDKFLLQLDRAFLVDPLGADQAKLLIVSWLTSSNLQ